MRIESHEKVEMVVVHTSGCCGAYLTDMEAEYEVCCECRDHCEVVSELVPVTFK